MNSSHLIFANENVIGGTYLSLYLFCFGEMWLLSFMHGTTGLYLKWRDYPLVIAYKRDKLRKFILIDIRTVMQKSFFYPNFTEESN